MKKVTRAEHDGKVGRIAEQVKGLRPGAAPVGTGKKVVSHFCPNPYRSLKANPKVNMKDLDGILEIDPVNLTCTAESGVTFQALVEATLKHGLTPCLVPELKEITIGGAVSGCSVESTSFKHGGFHDTCLEYEAVDGEGRVITCSLERDPEVFHLIHGSYGTMAKLTLLKFKLMKARPFVHMEYRTYPTFELFWADLLERSRVGDYDFVDGIIHSRDKFVVCLGTMVDHAPRTSFYEGMKIFYKSTLEFKEDYLTLPDYYFRYDRDAHWMTATFPVFQNPLFRLLLGNQMLGSSNFLTWSDRLRHVMKLKKGQEVVIDVFIPEKGMPDFYSWYEKDFDFFPLWVVPYNPPEIYPWLSDSYGEGMKGGMLVDCAIYGKQNQEPGKDYSELLERKVHELGGIKTLISRNHYKEDYFWQVYAKDRYFGMKARLDPRNLFGDIWTRFSPKNYQ